MTAASRTASWSMLRRRALSLGAVKTFDHAMHFLLPVVLTRCLDAATFGEYRLLWLMVGTVMAVATLNMPGGLYFYLPRSDARTRRLYVHQTMLFLAASGLVFALLISPWNPLLPAAQHLSHYGWQVPAFMALWIFTILLDYLPTIDERIRWQAAVTCGFTVARTALVAAAAWFTGDIGVILWMLLVVVLLKLALLLYYVRRFHGAGRPWFDRALFSAQLGRWRRSAARPRSSRCARRPTSGWRRACSRCRASPRSRSRRSSARWCTSCASRCSRPSCRP
jgi:O-antigen/teichoic acid export membrane protein